MNGYVLLPRINEDLFGNIDEEPLCRRGAWHWLFDKAAFRDSERWSGRANVQLHRGELCCSYRYLAQAWGWSHGKVQRWLSLLAGRGMVLLRRSAGGQLIITLLGYDRGRVGDEPTSESAKARPAKAESGSRESAANQQPSQRRIQESSSTDSCLGDAGRDAPPTEAEIAEVDRMVDDLTATMTGKRIRDPAAYGAAIEDEKFKRWLRGAPGRNDGGLYRFVCEHFPVGDQLYTLQAAISMALEAGSRASTPPDIMRSLNEIDALYRQQRGRTRRIIDRVKGARRAGSVASARQRFSL